MRAGRHLLAMLSESITSIWGVHPGRPDKIIVVATKIHLASVMERMLYR
jgi:hypothetical protein